MPPVGPKVILAIRNDMVVNDRRSAFEVEILSALKAVPDSDGSRISIVSCAAYSQVRIESEERPLLGLAPTVGLDLDRRQGRFDDHEFRRRYSLELESHPVECEWLRSRACGAGLVLLVDGQPGSSIVAAGLKEHLTRLECHRRWNDGLMIGGYVYHLKDRIKQAGGLWFAQHKVWVMPDAERWKYVQSLLPGDF